MYMTSRLRVNLKSKHLSRAFSQRARITFRLKMESRRTFRHRISLSRISESTPAVVQENGLAVRKRLGLLPKAIAVSSLFTGMILPGGVANGLSGPNTIWSPRRQVFSCYYGARTIPDAVANRAFPIRRRIILPPGLMQSHKNIFHRYDFSVLLGEKLLHLHF